MTHDGVIHIGRPGDFEGSHTQRSAVCDERRITCASDARTRQAGKEQEQNQEALCGTSGRFEDQLTSAATEGQQEESKRGQRHAARSVRPAGLWPTAGHDRTGGRSRVEGLDHEGDRCGGHHLLWTRRAGHVVLGWNRAHDLNQIIEPAHAGDHERCGTRPPLYNVEVCGRIGGRWSNREVLNGEGE